MKAGVGFTLSALILHLPTVCVEGMLSVLVELLNVTAIVVGELAQLPRILKLTPDTVPANTFEPVPVGVRVQGKPNIVGTPHKGLLPLTVAFVIVAEAPLEATEPEKLMVQDTGTPNEAGEETEMAPAGVLNAAPAGATVTALAIEAAPRQIAKADSEIRFFKLFIIFPHMDGELFRRGNGHDREVTVKP